MVVIIFTSILRMGFVISVRVATLIVSTCVAMIRIAFAKRIQVATVYCRPWSRLTLVTGVNLYHNLMDDLFNMSASRQVVCMDLGQD